MKTRYTNQPYYDREHIRHNGYHSEEKGVSRGQWYYPAFNFTLIDLLQRLFTGVKRLFVAIKYQFYKKTHASGAGHSDLPVTGKWKIPWFKIGLIGLFLFMFTQKDFQFSINMRAPQVLPGDEETANAQTDAAGQGMNIAQAISFKDRSKKASRKSGANTTTTVPLNESDVEEYIQRFRKVAVMEMKKFGIPASIKMAWGILESGAGRKSEAIVDNNHFGPLMKGQPYTTAWENWRAHSLLLQSNYSGLFHNGIDYRQWVKALDKAQVSSDRDFDNNILSLIERYQLDRLDQEFMQ